jgi:hypothetical protein
MIESPRETDPPLNAVLTFAATHCTNPDVSYPH